MNTRELEAQKLQKDWTENPRWRGIKRGYSAEDVIRLRGSLQPEQTLAKRGAEKLWNLVNNEPFVNSLGALTGNQAMQQAKAGLKAVYLSGWQVAGSVAGSVADSGLRSGFGMVVTPCVFDCDAAPQHPGGSTYQHHSEPESRAQQPRQFNAHVQVEVAQVVDRDDFHSIALHPCAFASFCSRIARIALHADTRLANVVCVASGSVMS
jgi:hypothetical protein